jgi:hypothetical protein
MTTPDTPGTDLSPSEVGDLATEISHVMLERFPQLRAVPADAIAQALAQVLPVYGAMVQTALFSHDYRRRERSAENLTKRTYVAGVLLRMAAEADQDALRGTDPAVNRAMAAKLRARAHQEGAQ